MKNNDKDIKKKVGDFDKVTKRSYEEFKEIKNIDDLLLFERNYLKGRESYLWFFLSQIRGIVNIDEKKRNGKTINAWKEKISKLVRSKKESFVVRTNQITSTEHEKRFLPFSGVTKIGSFHPIRDSLSRVYSFFVSRGYEVFEGSEVETKWHNFDSLNLENDHPARSWSDTFYLSENAKFLLRTHTSHSEARVMENNKNSEIMVVSGGKVYRNDDDDTTHSHQYTNFEIIRIGRNASFANLKWVLEDFFQWFFEKEVETRFRPSFFPFTEPSFEVDISCSSCKNDPKRCKVCKGTGWIEVLGAGLLNPIVLKNSGYDEKRFSGFAAGIGIERILMIKHGINDIRDFYLNDPRFLIQTSWK